MDNHETSSETKSEDTTSGRRFSWPIIVGFIVVIALILVGLFLPPISLGTRLSGGNPPQQTAGETPAPTAAVAAELPAGVSVTTTGDRAVGVSAVPASDLASVAAVLPAEVTATGDAYVIAYEGDAPVGQIAVPLPGGAPAKTLDIYGWDGTTWTHVPGQVDEVSAQAVTAEGPLARVVVVGATAAPEQPAVATDIDTTAETPAEVSPLLTEVSVGALRLGENGNLTGEMAAAPEGIGRRYLHVTNAGAIVDQAALTSLLNNTAVQDAQINSLVGQAAAEGYTGVHLDYQGATAQQQAAYTEFVTKLADALHARGLELAITLAPPLAVGTTWDTAGQDWAALGRLADVVNVQLPLDPTAYTEGGAAEQLLTWATGQIDRRKLNALVTAGAVSKVGEVFTHLPVDQALANLGQVRLITEAAEVEPGAPVSVALEGTAGPLEWDGAALAYRYNYEQAGQPQTVWLIGGDALNKRLAVARDFNLRGITVRGLDALGSGATYAAVLNSYLGRGEAPQPSGAAIAWTVRDGEDSVVASETGSDLAFEWAATENAGVYRVQAELVLGDTTAELGEVEITVVVPSDVAEATPEPTETPETTTGAPPAPTAPSAAVSAPGEATAVVNAPANIRTGPGISYGTIAGGAGGGTVLKLIGRNDAGTWLKVVLPSGEEGWILKDLVTINAGFNPNTLEVAAAPPPDTTTGGGAAAAPTVVPPSVAPAAVGQLELGGQAAGMPAGTMQYAGMTWVKKQHKWNPGDPPEAVAGLINEAHAAGMKILLSIPGQLYPSSIDYEAYTNFLGGVAALGPDAIEVWNEMNIDREWPAGQIDPAAYVNNMLRPAYQKIKAANPNVMVITGAPAPTGYFGGCTGAGCDDAPYVAGMMAAGAGSVSDCVGVHYNEGLMPPSATSGDPRGAGGHYTRYFQGMINAYTAAGAGRLCFTELGYLSGEEWGTLPAGFLWKAPYNLTVAEHAQYLAEAVRVGAQSGRVRLLIVFNVDFKTFNEDPQAGYAMIRPNGSCPACETLRQVMGR